MSHKPSDASDAPWSSWREVRNVSPTDACWSHSPCLSASIAAVGGIFQVDPWQPTLC